MAFFYFFSLSTNLFLQFSFLFFSFSYFLYHSSAESSIEQHPLCHGEDRSSLLQFKRSFVLDESYCDPSTDYTKFSTWKDIADDDCCSWDGVHCNNQTGNVIGLDLSDSCLYGSINSSSPLFRLIHLKSLDLSFNNFNLSRIPGEMKRLSKLKHLDLSFSNFSGQIPSQILQLSQLVSLNLQENLLILHKPSLKELVDSLTNLSELTLSSVDVSSRVPHSLLNLTSLTSLLIKNCALHGEFPSAIFQLPNLLVLNLKDNPDLTGYLPEFKASSPLEEMWFDGTNIRGKLPYSIGNLKSLSHFVARGCGFWGVIPSSIGNLTKLEVLDLTRNYLSGKIPSSSLGNLLQFKILSLSYNNFTSGTLDWISKLTNLEQLQFIETNTYGVIPSSFQNLTQLSVLQLPSNQLTGQFPFWLANFTKLTNLFLSNNNIQGPVPESIFSLPSIQNIDLGSNNLSGSLRFDSFLRSKNLNSLQLSYSRFSLVSNTYINVTTDLPKFQMLGLSGCNLREFPAFLRHQNELQYLGLSSNKIEEYVPNWILNLESLKFLFLADNSLTGFNKQHLRIFSKLNDLSMLDLSNNEFKGPLPIPPPSIVIYDVSENKFSGEISPLFCNLTSVLSLDLSNNNLHGNLPSCLGNLANFASVLEFKNNSLSGKIPDNFTSDCSTKMVDFSQNQIEGKVPRSLANCSKLEILNLEQNKMNDTFPSWLGILPRLRVLSLRSNKFHGVIGKPLTKFEFGKLQVIDLSRNNFSGKLPVDYFRNWVSMKIVDNDHQAYMQADTSFVKSDYNWTVNYEYSIRITNKGTDREFYRIVEFFVVVDLSSNSFEGEIPEIIGTLKELQSLNLSNNILTGHIPSSLGNLTNLEALDLSQNELSGDIPIQLALLTFLSIFNVSYNNLTGIVPQGNQFRTFENDSFSSNPGLCGTPLSRKCGDTRTTLSLPPSEDEDEDKESPFELYWEIMLAGFGSGLVIGVSWGYAMNTRKYEWLARRKFARWRRNRRNSCW